jgi:regulator of protease activity HflC (stomatin/prohibitin superfamily)
MKNSRVSDPNSPLRKGVFRLVIPIVLVIGAFIAFQIILRPHFYFFTQVREDQIGIKIRGGQIIAVVPPGVYHDIGLFVRMDTYSTQEFKFAVTDPEVITQDQQRIGVGVSGSVFRPGLADEAKLKSLWVQYKSLYTNDDALQAKMGDLSNQAMKVCVGDRPFQDSVIGSDRDALRQCIDEELNKLVMPFGLSIQNVVVPNVTLNPEVQAKMDAITQSRLDTEKAEQDEKKAIAEGKAQQAQQEAQIRVEQSIKQEEARQQTILAQLDVDRLTAQQQQIAAQKANDLLAAQKELEIAKAKAAAAIEQAKADLARENALAVLYNTYPEYLSLLLAQTNASAIKESDKFIFTPAGVFPNLVFGNVLPTISLPAFGPPAPETTTP